MAIDQARDDTPSMEGSAILMSRGIADKVVVITGTSSGLGEAAARHLAAQGATVVLGARRAEGGVHTEASAQNRLSWENALYSSEVTGTRNSPMDMPTSDFVRVGSLAELKAKGRLVVHGRHSADPGRSTMEDGSSRSTTAARTWAFRSIAAASRTAS